ncbi:MAG: stage 0 sporulation protein [Deltaproteobacteria bacterium]|jgi:cell fate regulator YaaT (PSP1 superfamily)|nr:stage 0 sporulation protein [Deltaproteobacteria bacterium]
MESERDNKGKGLPCRVKAFDRPRRGGARSPKDGTRGGDYPLRRAVNVRVRFGGLIQAFDATDLDVDIGVFVVARHEDVTRLGLVVSKPIIFPADQSQRSVYLPSDRRVLRVATADDLARQAENEVLEKESHEYCQAARQRLGLNMKLVAVEKTFDNYKVIFYYTAEERVDFRQLVKDLVRRLRTRIEMRQISFRHEALMLGGIGVCGRPFCCASFLKAFSPVSVRMAKEQKLSGNSVKISGVCGRLMCCLGFENALGESRPSRAGAEGAATSISDLSLDRKDAGREAREDSEPSAASGPGEGAEAPREGEVSRAESLAPAARGESVAEPQRGEGENPPSPEPTAKEGAGGED